ncbi:alpha/beta hydrolase [Aquibium carbonis]|uniref:Alpha/beta hydrolase n=1 Tax=Aquibium carbonis TaxID=2495581 RepID=A0A429Z1L7_9HYPH|nr:alpha/beta hydrolase [Aquibium carbonis]RST87528.1 alpha/beta hydrolase [Aquibium carbonis]
MAIFVLVHGAWHTGELMRPVADRMAAEGHEVHTPTLAGNRPGDPADVGLEEAIGSLVAFVDGHDLADIVLVGHSYGGMVITGAADRLRAGAIRRLVYWNAFVPNDGEALNDLVPDFFLAMFDEMAKTNGTVMMPFPIWREALTNDMSGADSAAAYARLVPQPYRTFTDRIALSRPPAAFEIPKSYINFTEDTGMPHAMPWHPRLSQKLGLFRLVQAPGSHEVCFSNPEGAARAILIAGRD